jgi:deazaflavin-dependent oxidoreductase (nitroreductase family)
MKRNDGVEGGSRVGERISDLYARAGRRMGHYRWFAPFMKHVGSRADRALIHASRGRLSISGPQMTTMLLKTTGRRSGKDRTVPLFYVRDGKNLVSVCENFGLQTPSSWPKNLLANPQTRIEIEGTAANYLARPATEEETARNMPRLTEMWPAHDTYLTRSGKRYVFVFEPVDAPS